MNSELNTYLENIRIIDTHEHLPGSWYKKEKNIDILSDYLSCYINHDFLSAGLDQKLLSIVINNDEDIVNKWKILEPYWKYVKFSGYGESIRIAINDLYNIDEILQENIQKLNSLYIKAINDESYFKNILKEKSKIEISILDSDLECDRDYFRSVFRVDNFIKPKWVTDVFFYSENQKKQISSFNDYLKECELVITNSIGKGACALKIGLAYERSLNFIKSNYYKAEFCYNNFFNEMTPWEYKTIYPNKDFEDYMLYYVLHNIRGKKIPVQIHTGIQAGNGNRIYQSNPMLLTNLFLEFPDIPFLIMHSGYPYFMELSSLAKVFPNVNIDMSWSHIISENNSQNALSEWLDVVPHNKICGFGGDYLFLDGVYGHQKIARRNISKVLYNKISNNKFSLDEAKTIAKLMLYDNPKRIFNI